MFVPILPQSNYIYVLAVPVAKFGTLSLATFPSDWQTFAHYDGLTVSSCEIHCCQKLNQHTYWILQFVMKRCQAPWPKAVWHLALISHTLREQIGYRVQLWVSHRRRSMQRDCRTKRDLLQGCLETHPNVRRSCRKYVVSTQQLSNQMV